MVNKKWFLWIQSALCALTAIAFSVVIIRIFKEGSAWQAAGHPTDWIFTREKVIAGIVPVLPILIASIAMTVVGLVRGIEDENKDKPVTDTEIKRDLICARVASPSDEMLRERALQKRIQISGWAGFALCMIPIFLYIVNGSHFAMTDPEGLEQVMASLVVHCLPWTATAFAILIISTLLTEKSMKRETDAASEQMKAEKAEGLKPTDRSSAAQADDGADRRRRIVRYVLLAAALCFIVIGINNGSMKDVLIKAVKICTECVGLG